MPEPSETLPFGLSKEQLPRVVIRFRVASTKMMSGFDEIVIQGAGDVILRTAVMANDPPSEVRGRVDAQLVERLLRLFQAEGMEGWDDEYPAETHDFVAKVLTVAVIEPPQKDVPQKEVKQKEVAMCRAEFAEFSRAYGALKLVAGLARPEVFSGAFFGRI